MAEKLYEYQGVAGRIHSIRDNLREKYASWKENNPNGVSGWVKEKCFSVKQSAGSGNGIDDYSHIYR